MKWKGLLDKKSLRAIKLKQREVFPKLLKEVYDQKICKQLLELVEESECISTYISIKDEVDTRLFINELFNKKKCVCAPVIDNQQMTMHQLTSLEATKEVAMNLLEPTSMIECEPDIIIVPLIAFNLKGYRIGYGGGYYDRYLKDKEVLKIGIAYSWMLESFVEDDFDIPLDIIVTETKSHNIT